jgi:hypothetical protein
MNELTPQLLDEIKQLLRRSSVRHGQAFRGMEKGSTAAEMAVEWGDRTPSYVQNVMRSVRYILGGRLPTGSANAYENSFGYRELWEQGASPELLDYVKGCLYELQQRNPDVKVEPMGKVVFPGGEVRRKFGKPVTYCDSCFLEMPCDCE